MGLVLFIRLAPAPVSQQLSASPCALRQVTCQSLSAAGLLLRDSSRAARPYSTVGVTEGVTVEVRGPKSPALLCHQTFSDVLKK